MGFELEKPLASFIDFRRVAGRVRPLGRDDDRHAWRPQAQGESFVKRERLFQVHHRELKPVVDAMHGSLQLASDPLDLATLPSQQRCRLRRSGSAPTRLAGTRCRVTRVIRSVHFQIEHDPLQAWPSARQFGQLHAARKDDLRPIRFIDRTGSVRQRDAASSHFATEARQKLKLIRPAGEVDDRPKLQFVFRTGLAPSLQSRHHASVLARRMKAGDLRPDGVQPRRSHLRRDLHASRNRQVTRLQQRLLVCHADGNQQPRNREAEKSHGNATGLKEDSRCT